MTPGRKIKLMIVIVDLATGTGSFARNLAGGLKRYFPDEFDITLLMFRDQELSHTDEFDRVRSLHMRVRESWRQMVELPIAVSRLRRQIEQVEPDLLLSVHTFSNLTSSLAAGERPVILTDHLNLSQRQAARGVGGVMRWLLKQIYRKRFAVGVSQAIVDDLRAHYDATRTQAILNGVDVDQIRQLANQPLTIDLPESFLVALGRLAPQKDLPTLLRAYKLARQQGLNEHLVLVGDGPERESIEALIDSLQLRPFVHLTGHLENPFPVLQRARMLVMSSLYEGFGLVLVEAMALGTPVVSTDCPSGPAEILSRGEFGSLVPIADPAALAKAILELSRDAELRQQFVDRSDERANQLSVKNMVRQYRDLIRTELKSRPQGE